MNCFMCKSGVLKEKLKNYIVDLDHCIIIVKNVPSLVCEQCGDVYYTNKVMKQLEEIVDKLEQNSQTFSQELSIVEYTKMTA